MDGLSARCDGLQPVALEAIDPERILYVAVPLDTYRSFFQVEFTRIAVQRYEISLIVYDSVNEVIVQWIR